jgi:hypothetical protein
MVACQNKRQSPRSKKPLGPGYQCCGDWKCRVQEDWNEILMMGELQVNQGDVAQTIYTQITYSGSHEADNSSEQDKVLEAVARGNWCGSHCNLQNELVDTHSDCRKTASPALATSWIGTFSMRNRRDQTYGAS